LIEILIVVIILGILAAVIVPQFTEAADDSRINSTALLVKSIQRKLETEKARSGVYPAALDPTWFEGQTLPRNPFYPDVTDTSGTLFEIVSTNNLHPQNKTDPTAGVFWYNTQNGILRARVTPGVDNADTMRIYNATNQAEITKLNQQK
jgi:type II secretory pathway pseudopilin PulG